MKAFYFDGENGETIREEAIPAELAEEAKTTRHELVSIIADLDDTIGEYFLNDQDPPNDVLKAAIRKATIALKFTPVFCGSAFKNKGVQKLLDGVVDLLWQAHQVTWPEPECNAGFCWYGWPVTGLTA
jgi:elongation factor G